MATYYWDKPQPQVPWERFVSLLTDQKILLVNLARQDMIGADERRLLRALLIDELLTASGHRPRGRHTP